MTDGTARATGVGSMPGEDFAQSLRIVLDVLPDLPHLPELPGRGAIADLTGRAVAVTAELGFDLQPAGWRLTDAPGVDHRRARSRLAQQHPRRNLLRRRMRYLRPTGLLRTRRRRRSCRVQRTRSGSVRDATRASAHRMSCRCR